MPSSLYRARTWAVSFVQLRCERIVLETAGGGRDELRRAHFSSGVNRPQTPRRLGVTCPSGSTSLPGHTRVANNLDVDDPPPAVTCYRGCHSHERAGDCQSTPSPTPQSQERKSSVVRVKRYRELSPWVTHPLAQCGGGTGQGKTRSTGSKEPARPVGLDTISPSLFVSSSLLSPSTLAAGGYIRGDSLDNVGLLIPPARLKTSPTHPHPGPPRHSLPLDVEHPLNTLHSPLAQSWASTRLSMIKDSMSRRGSSTLPRRPSTARLRSSTRRPC